MLNVADYIVITYLETYLKDVIGFTGNTPLLIILAAIKFGTVVAFFMHLRFDNPVVRRLFLLGIILALTVYVIVFFTLGIFTSQHGIHG